jgi:hypothetical protein
MTAWYVNDRSAFLRAEVHDVVGQLASSATREGLHIEPEQHDEWHASVGVLQIELARRAREIEILRDTLRSADLAEFRHVILEYDFRRRGLRLDCVLLGDGVITVVEFKRSRPTAADREQVTSYCINLVEFHEETRRLTETEGWIVAPVLAQTGGAVPATKARTASFHRSPWGAVLEGPLECGANTLHIALRSVLEARRSRAPIDRERWLSSRFSPSSTILDAAISLYGQHDVSAISGHAAPVERIRETTSEVAERISASIADKRNRIIFVSGAPGAGKTLVGLQLAFDPRFREDAVFVTGNAPLVDVLSAALKGAYRARSGQTNAGVPVLSGYSHEDARRVMDMSTFKIVKAHRFLGERGSDTGSADGRIVIFDEAQRTYEEGREVLRRKLDKDEAELILRSLEKSYDDGAVVVALVGHNQAINTGELGIAAWFKAADARGWHFVIGDETLALSEIEDRSTWAAHPKREVLKAGHLPHSLRYYRNSNVEQWAALVLSGQTESAREVAGELHKANDTIWLVRDLANARAWANARRVGEERAGIIASGQARRLAAEGLFVDLKPDIAKWMLAPLGDIRSSNMLETVQNQYQIQGLEMDYAIVCWDADLRRENDEWRSYKLAGADWRRDKALVIAKNSYRVLLTRARKGMVLFVPQGDQTGTDGTRKQEFYEGIASYLTKCGAKEWTGD